MFYERPSLGNQTFANGDASTLMEVARAAFDDTRYQALMTEHMRAVEDAYDQQIERVRGATGITLENPYRVKGLAPQEMIQRGEAGDAWSFFDKRLDELAAQHPDQRDVIKPPGPDGYMAPVYEEMRRREGRAMDTLERSPWTGSAFGMPLNPAALAGSFAGMMTDPLQGPINLIVGPSGRVAAGAKAVLWNAAKVGAANMAVEAVQQPVIQMWREKAGMEHGADLALKSIALSGLFGFGLDAGGRGASRGLGFTRGFDADANLDLAAKALPEDNPVRRAADGDPAALNEVAIAAGVADEPAVRGARQTMEIEDGLETRVPDVDDGEGLQRLIQALRSAEDDVEPPPGRASTTPEPRDAVLSDAVDPPAPRGKSFLKEGKPVHVATFKPRDLTADPETFQFRRATNAAGTTGRLSRVEQWDQMAAGKVVVFERANGERVIADGHHRLELAKRLSDDAGDTPAASRPPAPELDGYLFREADGWRAEDVAAYAAKKNMIDSPRVDPLDAARVLRERPDLFDRSMPAGDEVLRQARALAKLSDEGFGQAVAGVVPANYAALVGDLVPDQSRHAAMLSEIAEAAPNNVREARYLVGDLLQLPVHVETQLTLLGASRIERSVLKQRGQVLDAALKALKSDKRIFDMLDREAGRIEAAGNRLAPDENAARAIEAEKVSALIEQLATNRGPVSDWLSDAARAVTQGLPIKNAADVFSSRVRATLEADGMQGLLAAEPPPLRASGFDEPGGVDARLQVEALERDLAETIDEALHPEKALARQELLLSIDKPPAGKAKSTSDSLRSTTIDVPKDLTRWLGVPHGKFQADYSALAAKRTQRSSPGIDLSTPEAVRDFVEKVLTEASFAFRVVASKGDEARNAWDLVARDKDNSVLGVRLERKSADSYFVRTALVMPDDQLIKKLAAAADAFGGNGVKWRDGQSAALVRELLSGSTAHAGPRIADLIQIIDAQQANARFSLAQPYSHTLAANLRMPEIRRELLKTVNMLPPQVRLRVQDRIFVGGREIEGAWDGVDQLVYVAFAAGDPIRASRHEVIHALRQTGLLSDGEFETLHRFADATNMRTLYNIEERYRDVYAKAYGHRGDDYVESLLREETIAEMFADYSTNGRRFGSEDGGGVVDAIIDVIVKFMETVRHALDGLGFRDARDIFEAIERGDVARRAMRPIPMPGGGEIHGLNLFALRAYHGTPHQVDRFSMEKIGTGEGAQAFGHGLYFAENADVAKIYQNDLGRRYAVASGRTDLLDVVTRELSLGDVQAMRAVETNPTRISNLDKAIAELSAGRSFAEIAKNWPRTPFEFTFGDDIYKPVGNFYEVRLNVEPEELLDWDHPISAQGSAVQKVIKSLVREDHRDAMDLLAGKDAYRSVQGADRSKFMDQDAASRILSDAGIKGIRYFDGSSRARGEGTYNYVIFDDSLIEIVAVNGEPMPSLRANLDDATRTDAMGKLVEGCSL